MDQPPEDDHPGKGGARKCPGQGEQRGWTDGDEVEGGSKGGHSDRHSAPRLPHVQLKHLGRVSGKADEVDNR